MRCLFSLAVLFVKRIMGLFGDRACHGGGGYVVGLGAPSSFQLSVDSLQVRKSTYIRAASPHYQHCLIIVSRDFRVYRFL